MTMMIQHKKRPPVPSVAALALGLGHDDVDVRARLGYGSVKLSIAHLQPVGGWGTSIPTKNTKREVYVIGFGG